MSGLREQLEAVRTEHGYLDPALIVDVAREENHPLHNRFEWNDEAAGESWRREQAHRLVQSVRVQYTDPTGKPKDIRAYLPIDRPDSRQPAYEPTHEVMGDPFMRQLVLTRMEREWQTLKSRYGDLQEFADLVTNDMAAAS